MTDAHLLVVAAAPAGEAGIATAAGSTDTSMKNQTGVAVPVHGTQKGARPTLAGQGLKN